ncbi:MAG: MerR family transcriptional regulator [Gemmatimonadales bacterium]
MTGTAGVRQEDPLTTLREYRQLAPWNLRDLATVAGAILGASGVRPINAAASTSPTERTIRFYVARGLVTAPEGKGTAATYSYRHLLQVLAIKLRQMEGGTLAAIGKDLAETTGDVLERRVAAALGANIPAPNQLPLTSQDAAPRGRAGQALSAWAAAPPQPPTEDAGAAKWNRIAISRGLELHVREDHPLIRLAEREAEIADAVRLAVTRVLSRPRSPADQHQPRPARSEPPVPHTP